MIKINVFELKEYLERKNIIVKECKLTSYKIENKEDVFRQIDNIIYFQRSVGAYKENLLPRIRASIGKELEEYKSQVILVERYIKNLQNKKNSNKIDDYIKSKEKEILYKAQISLKHIALKDYREIIARSMSNYEICLGRVDESNLVLEDNKIIVGTIKYMTYNIKEHDIYSLIKRIKRKDIDISFQEIIDYYIEKEGLKETSRKYLEGLSNYPNEQLKVFKRYIEGKYDLREEDILELIYKAEILDNKYSIINGRGYNE